MRKPKRTDPFYSSAPWLKIRAKALARDRYCCVMCSISVRAKGVSRVDHILPRKQHPHLELELSNLRTLCNVCDGRRHASKLGALDYEDRPVIGANGFAIGSGWD